MKWSEWKQDFDLSCDVLQLAGTWHLRANFKHYVPFLLIEFSSVHTSPLTILWPACRTALLWNNEVLWQFDMWQNRIAAVQKASPGVYGAWQVTPSRREHQYVDYVLQHIAEPGAKPSSSDAQCYTFTTNPSFPLLKTNNCPSEGS